MDTNQTFIIVGTLGIHYSLNEHLECSGFSHLPENENISDKLKFPIAPNDEKWKELGNTANRKKALQLPHDVLKCLSTEDLLCLCLDYPYLIEVTFYNDYQEGIRNLICSFNGFQELLGRNDLVNVLFAKEQSMFSEVKTISSATIIEKGLFSYQRMVIDLLFTQECVIQSMNETQKKELSMILEENKNIRKQNPEVFGSASDITSLLQSSDFLSDKNNSLKSYPQFASTTIYTPNHSLVSGAEVLVANDVTSSPAEDSLMAHHLHDLYGAQLVETRTWKYDSSGWTWHTSETGEKVRIPISSESIYVSDNSYISVPEGLALFEVLCEV